MIPHLIKANGISMFPAGRAPITLSSEHINYAAVLEALRAGDYDVALALADVTTAVSMLTEGRVTITDEGVTFGGNVITGYLAGKMVQFFREGLPVAQYCKFLENLMANPSMTARNELYLFLESADLPITDDGCFLAYKAVDPNLKDKRTHSFDNSPGQVLTMPRQDVDDNRNVTCSYGFHAAAYEYAKNFLGGAGDRMVAVKINPADVVSVPSDYNNQKLRTCKYSVEFEIPDAANIFAGRSYVDTSPDSRDDLYMYWPNEYTSDDEDDDDIAF